MYKNMKSTKNTSWFRDAPHRWAQASLPLAYAIACVEVVAESSEKAGAIYSQIIEPAFPISNWGHRQALMVK